LILFLGEDDSVCVLAEGKLVQLPRPAADPAGRGRRRVAPAAGAALQHPHPPQGRPHRPHAGRKPHNHRQVTKLDCFLVERQNLENLGNSGRFENEITLVLLVVESKSKNF